MILPDSSARYPQTQEELEFHVNEQTPHWVCVTHTLAGEYVGLEEIDDGIWDVSFGPLKLGRMDERILRIEDHKGRTVRKQLSPMSPD